MAQRHMDRLTSFDTSFLANERSNGHMAIGAVLMCEGSPPSHEDFITHIRSRLHLLPRLRQRLLYPPLGLGTPFWVDDARFDLANHVRRAALPEPGTEAQFHELVGDVFAPPLDRSHPLWQLTLVEGFEDDRFAIVYKTHHAMADGISAVDIGTLLFDIEPKFEPVRDEEPWSPHTSPSRLGLLGHGLAGIFATARRMGRWLRRALREPGRARRRAADGLIGVWEVAWNLLRPAPKVPLNVDIGPGRSFSWATCDLDDFKQVKNVLGGTVNDVSLAVTAGVLRRWFDHHGYPTEDDLELKALVPVSLRMENEHGELGNKLTAMRAPLPVGIDDPVERLRAVSAAMDGLKASKQPLGAEAIWALNDWFRDFAPVLLRTTAAINFSTRLFNLLVTNFPGPQIPFYVLGRELTGIFPIGFLARHHALAIAIVSYNGQISFGVLADPDSIDDVDAIAGYVRESLDELLEAARVASRSNGHKLAGDSRARVARATQGITGS